MQIKRGNGCSNQENDSLSKELTAVVEDRNKYRSQLQDQEYYLTERERDEIAERLSRERILSWKMVREHLIEMISILADR